MWWLFQKKCPKTESELMLERIKTKLFPPLETKTDEEGNIYHVDCSVDSNLDAVLVDLEEGNNDPLTRESIRIAADKLYDIRSMLEAYRKLDPKSKYIIVANKKTKNLEDIKIIEE